MSKIICFLTPQSFVKVGTKIAEFVPLLGPTVEYSRKAKKITQISDPVSASAQGVRMLFTYCFGKVGAITLECSLWITLSVAGGVTCNPNLIAAGAQFGSLVLDEILE